MHSAHNIAFIGPEGIGKTHLAQAFAHAACTAGYKAYYLKASELRDKLDKALAWGNVARTISALVKPTVLVVDEDGDAFSIRTPPISSSISSIAVTKRKDQKVSC